MQRIPVPQVLDSDRPLVNDRNGFTVSHESRAEALQVALNETCAYAQQLWREMDGVRRYLLQSLPPDPRTPGPHPSASASPTGPDDEAGWDAWIQAYATVTSVLAGPHGDSGYGLGEARREARDRRTAPVLTLAAKYPGIGTSAGDKPQDSPVENVRAAAPDKAWSGIARAVGTGVLVYLALRGLRPRSV